MNDDAKEELRDAYAEIERLRKALEVIASGKFSGITLTSYPPQDPAVNYARAALEGKGWSRDEVYNNILKYLGYEVEGK